MPPGRERKVGLGRIDAAVDAMKPLGFPKDIVRKNVKKLLKVYGGDEGWVFIEEASYKLLIDTILEDEEESEQQKSSAEDEKPKENDVASVEPSEVISNMSELSASGPDGGVNPDRAGEGESSCVAVCKTENPLPPPCRIFSLYPPEKQKPLRKRFYGWISAEDEVDMQIKTEDGPREPPRKKNRSNWDVAPWDL